MGKSHQTDHEGNVKAEENYAAHQDDPAPSRESIKEPNDRPVGNIITWAVVIAIILLATIYLLYFFN
ncbi:hypothetical protein [Parapedobacter tibetensis]|uniref:hypothetical protein n=1 Tax=Parapedobacter tibetensis TaxID=2972951 RepID=UPI00214DA5F1|nr:hypothetical protein [Parapedobacter tibetensis]